MSPYEVMLDPIVRLVPFPAGGSKGKEVVGFEGEEAVGDPPMWLKELKLVPDVTDPPGISTLSLHLPSTLCGRDGLLPSARVESTDGSLILLYAGPDAGKGYLLIYETKRGSLSVIPQFDCLGMGCGTILGFSTIVVRLNRSDDYVLAQLMSNPGGRRAGFSLLLWFSSSTREWVEKLVHTPLKALDCNFIVDTSFVFDDGSKRAVCWVDLMVGILLLDMSEVNSTKPELCFIALPEGYQTVSAPHKRLGNPSMFRTMGCVRRTITFLSVDGYQRKGRNLLSDNVTVNTWTLKPSLEGWERGEQGALSMADLFEDGLPPLVLCPLLSIYEQHIVYFFSNDNPPQHGSILRVNLQKKKVELSCKYPLRINELFPNFIVSTFSRYMDPSYWLPLEKTFSKQIKR